MGLRIIQDVESFDPRKPPSIHQKWMRTMKRLKENTNPKFEHIGDYLEQLKASIPSLIVTPYNIQFFHVEWEIIKL